MRADVLQLVAVAAVCAALGIGFAESRDLLQPGRSERGGISLRPIVSGPTGAADGDWFYSPGTAHVSRAGSALRVRTHRRGIQLLSRQLPVFPARCYVVRALIGSTGRASLDVLNADASDLLRRLRISATPTPVNVSLRLRPRTERLSLALTARRRGVSLLLRDVAVAPVAC